jgi:hypothetical protein
MKEFPYELHPHALTTILQILVPDFHLEGHGEQCHTIWSLLRRPYSGRFSGEMIETTWAFSNGAAPFSKEMSHDNREEVLCDGMAIWNWRKTVSFGELQTACCRRFAEVKTGPFFARKLKEATKTHRKQRAILESFSTTLSEEDVLELEAEIKEWDRLVQAWEENGYQSKDIPRRELDPYQYPNSRTSSITSPLPASLNAKSDLTLNDVEASLAAAELTTNNNDGMQEISPSRWLALGLALELDQ